MGALRPQKHGLYTTMMVGFHAALPKAHEATQREIERTHGALEQVGGAVARERLRDAIEAFELALK
jgi:hypothetical protein